MSSLKVFLYFLIIRLLSVFIVKTYYVADEYWQSLEVAHKITFGYGYLTWEWVKGIRSYIHPLIIALLYKVLFLLKIDYVHLLVILPRILQAVFTSFSDYRFYVWCGKSKWSIFVISTSWYIFYTGSRTLSNTVEMSLTTIALSYFPWKKNEESSKFLWPVILAAFTRPTAIIPWIPLCLYHLKKSTYAVWELILKKYIPITIVVGSLCIAIDSYAHGSFIITPLEFFKVNVINEIGSFYGVHPWYWYFTVGFPPVMGITLLAFLFACVQIIKKRNDFPVQKQLLISILLTIIVYSFAPHKEFRFILSILPMCLYITSMYLCQWSRRASSVYLWMVALGLLIGNVIPAIYLGTVHQRGSIEVMPHLAKISREYVGENGRSAKIMFFMPCHSTPYYSHIHANVSMRFLTCKPNLNKVENYIDEADEFYKDPMHWIRVHFPVYPRTSLPTHLVFYDTLTPRIENFLTTYNQILSIGHADMPFDRTGKNILVYEQINTSGFKTDTEDKKSSTNTNNPDEQDEEL